MLFQTVIFVGSIRSFFLD